ncbi:adenosine receptor A3 [Nematostella vectensis]|uniref:adenosine receptor A3 n=1 Tax=Nematostella vectensis TaxID=45351 RepID=UPI0020770A8D|nr:adenosine receptor A3 [Nematostella vectensis]
MNFTELHGPWCLFREQYPWRQLLGATTTHALALQTLVINAATAPFTFALNILVIVSLVKFRSLRGTSNLILGAMAISDAVSGLITQPLYVAQESLFLQGKEPPCELEDASMLIGRTNSMVSIMILAILNVERYISLKYTLRHLVIVTSRRLTVVIAAACLLPILLNIAGSIDTLSPYNLYLVMIVVALSVLTSVYCSFKIMQISRRHQRQIAADHITTGLPRNRLKFSSVRALFIIVTTLRLFTYGLIFVSNIFKEKLMVFGPIALNIALLVSVVNPIVYCARIKSFKKAFKKILGFSKVKISGTLTQCQTRSSRDCVKNCVRRNQVPGVVRDFCG